MQKNYQNKNLSYDPAPFPLDQRGQGLIEYLIIVALIAVASIGIMSVVGQAVGTRFASISEALQGRRKEHAVQSVDENMLRKKDLGDFMNGVGGAGREGR